MDSTIAELKSKPFHPSDIQKKWDNSKLSGPISLLVEDLIERKLTESDFVGAYVLLFLQSRGSWLGNSDHFRILPR